MNQVTVPSTDIARSKAFYEGLGLRLIVDTPHYLRFECPEGGATFSCALTDQAPDGAGPSVKVYFEYDRDRLDREAARLVAAGYVIDQMPADQRYLWREARLRDPDGNHLVLYHAGENRRFPPWRVSEESA
ncbi:VOC family protein [Yunchengibacter salinarum]|uniref:VOC family protein n=1 Tax=Yunchengibacter salinarum TaxID=3133399 RepID=UPI0035B64FE7